MPGPDSVAQFKFKRTLEQLAKKEGRGTELISLYVPPDRKIHEVLGQLREELGTAVNIKSRTTRNNVQDGIERTIQRRTTARTRRRQRHFWHTSYRWDGGSRCYSEGTQSRDSEDLHVGNTRQEQGWWTVCSKVRSDQRTSHQRLLQTRRPALQRDDAGNSRPERNHHRRTRTHKVRL